MIARLRALPLPLRLPVIIPLVIAVIIIAVAGALVDFAIAAWHLTPFASHSFTEGEPWPLGSLGLSVTGRCGCQWAIIDGPNGALVGPRIVRYPIAHRLIA